MKNILVAIDFEEKPEQLIDYAASFAHKFDAHLWILHIAAPDPDFVGYEPGPQYIRDIRAEDLRDEHRFIQDRAKKLQDTGINAEGLLLQGETVKTILAEVDKLSSDLLIIGSHEHSFFYNLFAENTALEIFKRVKTPLLTVPL
ncbi:MAG: universal stress protein [Owenweeksia sp.]